MKRFAILMLGLSTLGLSAFTPQLAEPVDSAAVAAIRDEGLNRSQVMDTAFWLTDRYGPRLNGSPEFEEAGEWAVGRLESWGLSSVGKERFSSGRGWSLVNFHATMTAPRTMPIIGVPKAWSPGLSGPVVADVVRPIITTEADAARYRGRLKGKIVLTQPAREVRMWEHGDGAVLRYEDQDGRWLRQAMTPERGLALTRPGTTTTTTTTTTTASATPNARPTMAAARLQGGAFDLAAFYKAEGVVALFDRGASTDLASGGSNLSWMQQRPDGGTVFVEDGPSAYDDPSGLLPQVRLAVEHYNRMVRLIEHDVPVTVELNVQVKFTEESSARPNGFNVVGEIPGSDKADEVVLIGAHFDSWHGATGATDNAAGSAAVMEVMRILQATKLRPRRTIRVGLWGEEETDLRGSLAYTRQHLGTLAEPKPGLASLAAYFNLDNGTGPIRGVWMQGNSAVVPIFRAWARPLEDLGVNILSPRRVQYTDHESFHDLGVPAFQFVQDRYEYNSRTHHSNMDFYDRIQPDDLRQAATVAAVFVWHAAMRAAPLPRAVRPAGGQ